MKRSFLSMPGRGGSRNAATARFRRIQSVATRLMRTAVLLGAALQPVGCVSTIHVTPLPAPPDTRRTPTRSPISLYFDQALVTCHPAAQTHVPTGTLTAGIDADFALGPALTKTILDTIRTHFRDVKESSSPQCGPDSSGIVVAKLAKPPEIQIRWVQKFWIIGGGTTMEIAIDVAIRTCDGREIWHAVVSSFRTEESWQVFVHIPSEGAFRPAVDLALADLSQKLDAALLSADLSALEQGGTK